jgi:hypothetical protein
MNFFSKYTVKKFVLFCTCYVDSTYFPVDFFNNCAKLSILTQVQNSSRVRHGSLGCGMAQRVRHGSEGAAWLSRVRHGSLGCGMAQRVRHGS